MVFAKYRYYPTNINYLILLQCSTAAHHVFHTKLGVQDLLTETDGLGGDLDQFVVVDELDGLFQGHNDGRRQDQLFVGTRGTDGGQMLFLAGIDGDRLGRTLWQGTWKQPAKIRLCFTAAKRLYLYHRLRGIWLHRRDPRNRTLRSFCLERLSHRASRAR